MTTLSPAPASTTPGLPRISAAVMATRSREQFIPSLLERLGNDVPVVWDEQRDPWETGRRSLLAHDPDATHHLVIQDDALPCPDLLPGIEEMLRHVPPQVPLGLYIGKMRPHYPKVAARVDHAVRAGSPWMRMEGPWWGVAVVVPTAAIPAIVTFGDEHPVRDPASGLNVYDKRISRYFASVGIDCWYPIPSLVDHRTDGASLFKGRQNTGRYAQRFIGDSSPLTIDWAARPPEPPASGYLPQPNGRIECWWCGMETRSQTQMLRHLQRDHRHETDAGPVELRCRLGSRTVSRDLWELISEGVVIDMDGDPVLVSRSHYQSVLHGRGYKAYDL